jgi:hypothetical protein
MLRISLFGPPNRRKQPERYATYRLKLIGNNKKYKKELTIEKSYIKLRVEYRSF